MSIPLSKCRASFEQSSVKEAAQAVDDKPEVWLWMYMDDC